MEKSNRFLVAAILVGDKSKAKFAKNISRYWRLQGVKVTPKDIMSALKRVDYEDILGATTSQEITSLLVSPKNQKKLSRFTA